MDETPQVNSTEFIFVSESAILGGIETLMVRLANVVHDQNHSVTAFCPDGPIVPEIRPGVAWSEAVEKTPLSQALALHRPKPGTTHISLWVSHPYMLRDAYRFQRMLWKKWKITSNCLSGIFIPAQFFSRDTAGKIKDALIMRLPPRGAIYFMSDAVRSSFVEIRGDAYRKWPVKRLAASDTTTDVQWEPRDTGELSVVSVGRMTPFKAYNFGASDIVAKLRNDGIDCTWHIWGDGDDLEAAQEHARAIGVEEHVRFRGTLPYSQLAAEVCTHDVFVGMGTAALEAAVCGMPTVLAVVSSRHECAGYLYEAPSDSVGEDVADLERREVETVLREFLSMTHRQKADVGGKCRAAVKARTKNDNAETIADLSDGLQYPPKAGARIRMGLYCALIDTRRALWQRRPTP